ncbi:MAG: LytTR family transcriptional regulator DNA-binding domain-containing protein [Firmicutes bacterium]|nr:LytTR family transcriptional regulator DNA-binding domain-containing protein [Bacillota bacterium]
MESEIEKTALNKMVKARTHLLFDHPFIGAQAIRYPLKSAGTTGNIKVDTAATNGINIVFNPANTLKVSKLLDWIVNGEDLYIVGSNEFGQKSIESRNFHYFIVEEDDVYGVLGNTRLLIRMKLYEIEELLTSKDFIRISKFCLVSIAKIDYIKPALNSKLDLLMKNGDTLEVNRGYYKDFKQALKI